MFNISDDFFCNVRGQILINPKIMESPNSINQISWSKLKSNKEVFFLRIFSKDSNCPFNLKAIIRYIENKKEYKSIFFSIFLIIIGGFITKGGYSILVRFVHNPNTIDKVSIVTLFVPAVIDFGLCFDFLFISTAL